MHWRRCCGNGPNICSARRCLLAVSIDGKTLCSTLAGHGRSVHLPSVLDQRTGFVLSQQEVDGKTNKHKGEQELLKTIVLKGRLVTGDAMFCQRDTCQQIVDADGWGRPACRR